MKEHASYLLYAPEWFPPPTRGGGGEWPRQCDFARFVAINTFRRLLRATDTCDVFSFDKDGCQSLKLSACGFFFSGYVLKTFE